jgi:hypothetical protein
MAIGGLVVDGCAIFGGSSFVVVLLRDSIGLVISFGISVSLITTDTEA